MKVLAVAVVFAAGCLPAPQAGEWIPIDQLEGADFSTVPASPRTGERLRITTFNAELGRDVDAIAEAFETEPDLLLTDVLLVQEIENHLDEPGSRAARLANRLAMAYAYAPARDIEGDATHGLAILSRREMTDVAVMRLPEFELAIHSRKRIAIAATVDGIRVADVHLDTRLNITERVVQLDPVVATSPETAVIGGDFNTNPYVWVDGTVPLTNVDAVSDFDQAELLDDYMIDNGFDAPTSGSGPTQDAVVTQLRLDSVYTRGVVAGDSGVVRDVNVSDHRPLWVDIEL